MYYVKDNTEINKKQDSGIKCLIKKLFCIEKLISATLIIGLNLNIFLMFFIIISILNSKLGCYRDVEIKDVSHLSFFLISISALIYVRNSKN